MATCTNCGRDHALQNATEVAVAENGSPTVLRCTRCASTAGREHRRLSRINEDNLNDYVPAPSEPISLEQARARTALLQQSLAEIIH
jgi:hypothetical protein